MYAVNISGNTVTDLGAAPNPGGGAYAKFIAINLHSAAVSVQEADASTGPFTDVEGSEGAGIAVNQSAELIVKKRYLALEGGAGQVVMLRE